MSEMIDYIEVEKKILSIRGQSVLLDSSVAELYGVQTRRVNEAVKNNLDKFPEGYIVTLTAEEWISLRSKSLILDSHSESKCVDPTGDLENLMSKISTSSLSDVQTQMTADEVEPLRSKISTLNEKKGRGQHSKYLPTAFTEKGLCMLATILKSQRATQTTIAHRRDVC